MSDIATDYRLPGLLVLAFTKGVTILPTEFTTYLQQEPEGWTTFQDHPTAGGIWKDGRPASPRRSEEAATPTGEADLPGGEEQRSQDIGDKQLESGEIGHPSQDVPTETESAPAAEESKPDHASKLPVPQVTKILSGISFSDPKKQT